MFGGNGLANTMTNVPNREEERSMDENKRPLGRCMACLNPVEVCKCKRTEQEPLSQEAKDNIQKMIGIMTVDLKDHVKLVNDKARLIALSKDLLKGADLLAREENLIQPFLAIILRHVDTISEFKLTGDD